MSNRKIAVVLFNLGGPDKPASVRPFLINLFKDPAILRVPFFVRPLLARVIALARTKAASANYAILGGKSPLLELTEEQARALEGALPDMQAKCFVAMRYWHPFSDACAREKPRYVEVEWRLRGRQKVERADRRQGAHQVRRRPAHGGRGRTGARERRALHGLPRRPPHSLTRARAPVRSGRPARRRLGGRASVRPDRRSAEPPLRGGAVRRGPGHLPPYGAARRGRARRTLRRPRLGTPARP